MLYWTGLMLCATLGSVWILAPREDVAQPRKAAGAEPERVDEIKPIRGARTDDADEPAAAAKRAAHRDAGLRPVPFTTKTVHASARVVISPDLRDPFLVARNAPKDGKPAQREPLRLHDDLRDPFAAHRDRPRDATPPADLRDPFEGPRAPIPCAPTTADGVKIQRPKSMRTKQCPAASSHRQRDRIATL
jgi:hypothetical protein